MRPDYPTEVRPVSASLRDAAGAWPAAVWLALASVVAIYGGGGASSAGIALAAAGLPRRLLPGRGRERGRARLVGAPPQRRVLVYIGALALVGLVSYASIAWSLTPQTSYGDANRWLVAAAAAACGLLARAPAAPPARGRRVGALRRRLPLVAYAIQQRAHGVFFQTSPRLQGVLGYPNAIGAYAALTAPGALWLASSHAPPAPRRGLRDARAARARARPRLLARRARGRGARLRRLAGRRASGAPRAAPR